MSGGGIFYHHFTTNLLLSLEVKIFFASWSVFGKGRGKNIVTPFFWTQCIQATTVRISNHLLSVISEK